ncbi:MAG: prolyl oligopeptidase family serine peptidase [Fibrobacteria bacterium]
MKNTFALAILLSTINAGAACMNGLWDIGYTWIKDCTGPYDGLYGTGTGSTVTRDSVTIMAGATPHVLSWKLHYFPGTVTGHISGAKLPLLVGLHPWGTAGQSIASLLNVESDLMQYEGGWEDALVLTVALENENNLNTWWDGSKVSGVPTTWVMNGIITLVQARMADACAKLTTAGASLSGKTVDSNRVYLYGASMGGSGTYHVGIRHPEIFAAIHANAGFADYLGGPCGNEAFCTSFDTDFIGTSGAALNMAGLDGVNYPARSYSDMSWFIGTHKGASWSTVNGSKRYEPPYIMMTHGTADNTVDISSANRLKAVLDSKKFGYSFFRHTGGHAAQNYMHLDWLLGFRKDQSYLAFGNNSTNVTSSDESYNFLDRIYWQPSTIQDSAAKYQIDIIGTGTVDVTPRRLQAFRVYPSRTYRYWKNGVGSGTLVSSTSDSVLTIPSLAVSGTTTLLIRLEPTATISTAIPNLAPTADSVLVTTTSGLVSAIAAAPSGRTIMLADGTYDISAVAPLRFLTSNVMLYGKSRNPDLAIIKGAGFKGPDRNEELIKIENTSMRFAYFTLRDGRGNGLKVQNGGSNDIVVHGVYFTDICERSLKAPDQAISYRGQIRYCKFEQVTPITADITDLQDGGDYIAGMDCMKVEDWNIHHNLFKNIRGMNGGGRAGIFLWNVCNRDTIESNTFMGCDRGIALGNNLNTNVGMDNGMVRNNIIVAGANIAIEICNTTGTKFRWNSVMSTDPSYYRRIQIINNGTVPFYGNYIVGRVNKVSGSDLDTTLRKNTWVNEVNASSKWWFK